jgi:hypothetical protein
MMMMMMMIIIKYSIGLPHRCVLLDKTDDIKKNLMKEIYIEIYIVDVRSITDIFKII